MTLVILLAGLLLATAPVPVLAQQSGGLGGVLDTLGGLLGGAPQKIQGTVVLAQDGTLVVRGVDKRTWRIDTASIDPAVRRELAPGQPVEVSVRGGGQSVLTATALTTQGAAPARPAFDSVAGTVQEANDGRVLFKTREGFTVPVDVSQIRGLPYLAVDQPATLYYEQGSRQEIVGVWIEPGTTSASPSASPAASRGEERVQGLVESVAIGSLRLQQAGGDLIDVDTAGVDRTTLQAVRPGDIVTVTGTRRDGRLVARSIEPESVSR